MSDSGTQYQTLDKINTLLAIANEQEMSQKISQNIPILFQLFNSFKTRLSFGQITLNDKEKVTEALKFVDTLNLFMEENDVRKFKDKMMEIRDLSKRRNYEYKEDILKKITYTEMTIINHKKLYFRNLYFNNHIGLSNEIENELDQVYKGNKFDFKLFKQMQNIFWVVKNVIDENKKKELDERLKSMKDESHKIKEKKYGGSSYLGRGYQRNDNYINDYNDYKSYSGYDYNDNFIRNDDNNPYYNKNYINKGYHYGGRGGYMNSSNRKYYIKKQEEKEIEIPSDPSFYSKGKENDLKLNEINENNNTNFNNEQVQENANDNLVIPESNNINNINGGNDLEVNNNNEINQINANGGNGDEINIQNNNINLDLNQNNGGNGEMPNINNDNNKEQSDINQTNDIEIISGNSNISSYNKNKRKSYPNKMIAIELPSNEEINENSYNEENKNNGAKIDNTNNINNSNENRYISNNYNYNHNGENNIEYRQYNNDYRDNKYKNYYYNNGYKTNTYNKNNYRNNYNNTRHNIRNNLSGNNYGDNNNNKRLLFVEIDANNNPIENKSENNEIINGQEKEIVDNSTQINNEPNGEELNNNENININKNEEEKLNSNNEKDEQKLENEQQSEQINDNKKEINKDDIQINNGENKEEIKEKENNLDIKKEKNIDEKKEEILEEKKLENLISKKEDNLIEKNEENLIEKKEENLIEKKEEENEDEKIKDIKTISENINLNPEDDITAKISKSDSNINKIDINEVKNPEFNIPELEEENLHNSNTIPQENEEMSEEEEEMPENFEGQFKAFIIESGGMEPKGSFKVVTKNNNSEENEENENNEMENNFDENDLDEHINADIENDNFIGMNDVEQEKEIKLKECLDKLNIHKIIIEALDELEEERKLRLKILHKLDDNYKNEAINPKYTLYKNEFFQQNSQIFSNELMDQIKEYNSNPTFSNMPLYNFIMMRYYSNYSHMKDNDIMSEYFNIKTKEIEYPKIIWNNMQDFEKKILIPLYQKTIEIRKKKYNSLNYIYNLYEGCIKKIFQNSKDLDEVQKFGAFSNTFMIDYGETDIDICLVPKCNITYFRNTYVDKLIHGLKNNKLGTFREIQTNENYNSCIILKGEYIEKNQKININILVNNKIPICHSILLRLYALYDQRFHIMGIYLKYWAKINGLYCPNFLPSYALLFMIIHFLQKVVEPKVLPNLQKIPIFDNEKNITEPQYGKKLYEYSYEYKTITTNLYYENDAKRIKEYMSAINNNKINEETVTNLLVKFFEYYSYCYDSNQKISINKDLIESLKKGDDNISFSIEDPFDIMTNPGKNLEKDSENSQKFIKAMKKEVNLILSGEYVKRFEYEKERLARINKK